MTAALHLPGVRFAVFTAPPRERIRAHAHANPHIFCLLSGGLEQADGAHGRHLRPGDVRISGPDGRHDIDFAGTDSLCAVLHLTDSRAARFDAPGLTGSRFAAGSPLAEAFQDVAEHGAQDPARLWLRVREILAGLTPSPHETPDWLAEARHELADRPRRAVTAGLARRARVSPEHLARAFRRRYGMTVGEARKMAMLGRALALARTDMPLAEVALDAGFAHQSHLTNVMRSMLGITPQAWRRRHAA